MSAFPKRGLLVALILLVAIVGGVALAQFPGGADDSSPIGDVRTLLEVIALLNTQYVDPVSTVDLLREYVRHGTIDGMLREALDDNYTRFLDRHAYEQMQVDTTGVFGGIGIVVGIRDERLTIISPIVGTPGFDAGLRGGDRITAVNGTPTDYMSLDEAVSRMRGEEGTEITLTIERGEEEPFDVEIVREEIQVPSITAQETVGPEEAPFLSSRLGYVQLASFNERSARELDEALNELDAAQVEGLILDLRNNPGGLLNAAMDVANRFISDGALLHIEGRDGQRRTVNATPFETRTQVPMVVLVNEFSASASEIVAGALRDQGIASLVGTRTFGKGLVQTVVPLRNGGALSLTTARYQTSGGHYIHEDGLEPDYIVEVPEEEEASAYEHMDEEGIRLDDPQIREALEVLNEMVRMGVASRRAG